MFLSLIYIKGQFVEAFVGQVGLLYKKTNGFRYLETGSAEGLTKKEAAQSWGSLHKVQIYWTLGLAVFRHPKAH